MEELSQAAMARARFGAQRQERVTVYVPRDVAYNLDKMNQLTKTVLGKLGCDGCHSGRIIDWLVIEDFVVNPKTLAVEELVPQFQHQF